MERDRFWLLVSLAGGYPPEHEEDSFAPIVRELVEGGRADIVAFAESLAEVLHSLDLPQLAALRRSDRNYEQSTDAFLYNRCSVILDGPEAYSAVLQDSAKFQAYVDGEISSEAILYVAENAHQILTGEDLDLETKYNYESRSNIDAWG